MPDATWAAISIWSEKCRVAPLSSVTQEEIQNHSWRLHVSRHCELTISSTYLTIQRATFDHLYEKNKFCSMLECQTLQQEQTSKCSGLTLEVLQQAAVLHQLCDDVDGLLQGADGVQLDQLEVPQPLHDLSLPQKVLSVHGA